jgi:hypothetical protein
VILTQLGDKTAGKLVFAGIEVSHLGVYIEDEKRGNEGEEVFLFRHI